MQQQSLAEQRVASVASVANVANVAPKRKRRARKASETRPALPATAQEERDSAAPAEERDDGFVVVRRGRIAAALSTHLKTANVFEDLDDAQDNTLGIDEEIAAGTMMEDDEWTG